VIDAVADDYNSVQTVQPIGKRFSDFPITSDRSGRCIVWVSETIF